MVAGVIEFGRFVGGNVRSWTAPVTSISLVTLTTLMLATVAVPTVASAQEATCEGTYASDQLLLDIGELERSIGQSDEKTSLAKAVTLRNNLACADQFLPANFLARVYRGLAGGFYVGGDRKTAETWYRTALEVDDRFRYGIEDLPGDHPLLIVYSSMLQVQDDQDPVPVAGKAFPDGGEWYLDGRRTEAPAARTGRPHVLQRKYGGAVQTWLINGNGFPSVALVDGKNIAEVDKRKRKRDRRKFDVEVHDMGQGAIEVERSTPPEQIPLIVTGGALIAVSLGLTAGSYASKRNFTTIQDSETNLAKSQQATNRLALGAFAAAALGAGSLTYGIAIGQDGFQGGFRGRF